MIAGFLPSASKYCFIPAAHVDFPAPGGPHSTMPNRVGIVSSRITGREGSVALRSSQNPILESASSIFDKFTCSDPNWELDSSSIKGSNFFTCNELGAVLANRSALTLVGSGYFRNDFLWEHAIPRATRLKGPFQFSSTECLVLKIPKLECSSSSPARWGSLSPIPAVSASCVN